MLTIGGSTYICSPSLTMRARLISLRSVPTFALPAAVIASITREFAGSEYTPGEFTPPAMSTVTFGGVTTMGSGAAIGSECPRRTTAADTPTTINATIERARLCKEEKCKSENQSANRSR